MLARPRVDCSCFWLKMEVKNLNAFAVWPKIGCKMIAAVDVTDARSQSFFGPYSTFMLVLVT